MIRLLIATRNEAQDLGFTPARMRPDILNRRRGQPADDMGKPLCEEVRGGDVKPTTRVKVL